jgi:NAD(P)-dependent dehydrogenase (short-subunit alcohol dehydrogenase family)
MGDTDRRGRLGVDLTGKVAAVTGTGAIGAAIITRLAGAGAAVTAWDRSADALAGVRDAKATRVVDVTSAESLAAAAAATVAAFGGIDILVTTAAVATFAPVAEMSPDLWRETIEINLTGAFLSCQAVLGSMIARGGGSIVNISSIGGQRGEPRFAHYCASKFGVIGLSQSLAREVGESGIRVNCVAPGAIDSPMNTDTLLRDAGQLGVSLAEVEEMVRRKVSLRRIGATDDVADAELFLASDLAGYVTGETVSVNGGVF